MYLPYFDQDLETKKKVVEILAHVWIWKYPCQARVKAAVSTTTVASLFAKTCRETPDQGEG